MNCFVSFMVFISVRKSMLLTSFHAVSFLTLVAFVKFFLFLLLFVAAVAVSLLFFPLLRMPPRIITVFPLTLYVPARCFIFTFFILFSSPKKKKYNSLRFIFFCFISFSDFIFLKFFVFSTKNFAFFSLLNNSFFLFSLF